MVSYYLNSGDEEGADMFPPYIWREHGLDTSLKRKPSGSYGHDLELLLIQYYVEGKFSSYLPASPRWVIT